VHTEAATQKHVSHTATSEMHKGPRNENHTELSNHKLLVKSRETIHPAAVLDKSFQKSKNASDLYMNIFSYNSALLIKKTFLFFSLACATQRQCRREQTCPPRPSLQA